MLELLDVLKLSIPVLLALFGWLLNESSKRYWQRHKGKEARYIALLESLPGFYVGANPATAKDDKEEFLKQASIVWLYCPDSIIQQIYTFLDYVSPGANKSDKEKEQAVGEIVFLMRKDLLGKRFWLMRQDQLDKRFWLCDRTRLKASEYRHLKAT